jgi:cell division protein FtsL
VITNRLLSLAGIALLLTALAVIYSKYYSRLMFIDIQKQEKALDQYEIQWGQMQLELKMLAEQNRVELKAQEELKLMMPLREKIIYIKP